MSRSLISTSLVLPIAFDMVTRRKFVRDSCSACLGLLAVASGAAVLSGCAGISEIDASVHNNTIVVPLASIAKGEKIKLIRVAKLSYDILLVLGENKDHRALEMRCTHADNILTASNSGLYCTFHGSAFNLRGEVINGPAIRPLKNFRTTEEDNRIVIYLS